QFEMSVSSAQEILGEVPSFWLGTAGERGGGFLPFGAGKRAEVYCLGQAWAGYYWSPYHSWRRKDVQWVQATPVTKLLQKQKFDPELRWRLEWADVNMLAHEGKAAEALAALKGRLAEGKTYRDLSRRLDMPALGSAMGTANMTRQAKDLAKRLKRATTTSRDAAAIELMLGSMYYARKAYVPAAEHYLKVVKAYPFPARMYHNFRTALHCLRAGAPRKVKAELDAYLRKVARVQEIVPPLLSEAGQHYLALRSSTALTYRKRLNSTYPASTARDKMEQAIDKQRQRLRKTR
ncbi:hypothetical protein LCGC14_1776280, partial [marine sediment metagenome]